MEQDPALHAAPSPAAVPCHRPIAQEEPLAEHIGAFQASAQALTSWAIAAGAGRICIYARADRLGRGGAGERARQLHSLGLVRLLPQRRGHDGLFEYRVERTAAPFSATRTPPDPHGLKPDTRLLLELASEIADAGERFPSDRDAAAILGFKRAEVVSRQFAELRRRGLVRWHLTAAGLDAELIRVVTIVETSATSWSPREAEDG